MSRRLAVLPCDLRPLIPRLRAAIRQEEAQQLIRQKGFFVTKISERSKAKKKGPAQKKGGRRGKKKSFTIGKISTKQLCIFTRQLSTLQDAGLPILRSLKILESRGPRQRLAGIEVFAATRAPKECHLVIDRGGIAGRVTSVARSRTLGKTIGLAMLAPPLAEPGSEIRIRAEGGEMLAARVVAVPFYDPGNLRQRAGRAA